MYELIKKATGGLSPTDLTYEQMGQLLIEYREAKEELRRQLFKVEELLKELEQLFLEKFREDELDGIKLTSLGVLITAQDHEFFEVKDWDKFAQWVLEQQDLDFLQRRASVTALRAYHHAAGELPPGVLMGSRARLSVRRRRGSTTNGDEG